MTKSHKPAGRSLMFALNGRERNQAQQALDTERKRYADYVLQYLKAGQDVPQQVRETCEALGVVVE